MQQRIPLKVLLAERGLQQPGCFASLCALLHLVSVPQVLLAKRKLDGKYYAVKVLQKKIVLNRKEVKRNTFSTHFPSFLPLG